MTHLRHSIVRQTLKQPHSLARHITGEKEKTEGEHAAGRAELEAAHKHAATADWLATAPTVIAVPRPITKVEAMPAQNRPCARANTSTMIAPEHGRNPTATTADRPRRQPPGPANCSGSGPCA